jgi:hypothetical protein
MRRSACESDYLVFIHLSDEAVAGSARVALIVGTEIRVCDPAFEACS